MFEKNINITKRISAFLLALIMLLGALPLNVFAEAMRGNNDSVVMESNTTNKEKPSAEPKGTDPEKHIISFNPNGGSGDMKSVEVEDGKEYSLPKNEFKAPEGKEFKSWLMGDEELKEGHKLVVTKDIELKANWKDVKVNPAKRALNSLLGKDKEELDISKELVGEAVTNDGEYTGPAHNSVVSSDGKVQIRNFEVFWTSTDRDTIVSKNIVESYVGLRSGFDKEPKMQINWALSGENNYNKGDLTINIPDAKVDEEGKLMYPITGYPCPEAKFNEDGSINYNADYGNATFAYYYDKKEMTTKIINVTDLSPGASGTLTLTYGDFKGNLQYVKDMYKIPILPNIELSYGKETLKTKDKTLFIQIDTSFAAGVSKKEEGVYKSWQDSWGNDAKPENPEDYWYGIYEIGFRIYDQAQTNINVDLKDTIGKIYTYSAYEGKRGWYDQNQYIGAKDKSAFLSGMGDGEVLDTPNTHSIIGYTDINKGKGQFKKSDNPKEVSWPTYNVNSKNKYKKDSKLYKDDYSKNSAYVLIKIPYKELGLDKKDKSYYLRFDNGIEMTATPLESNDKPKTGKSGGNVGVYYTYVPEIPFTPPGKDDLSMNKCFYSNKSFKYNSTETEGNYDYVTGLLNNSSYLIEANPLTELYYDREINWAFESKSRLANKTYDKAFEDPSNPLAAYGKKKVKYELIDDYLYLGNDYKNELTPEDYSVKEVYLNIGLYDYTGSGKVGYNYKNVIDTIHPIIYGRKSSTGQWEKLIEFDYKTVSGDRIYLGTEDYNTKISNVVKHKPYNVKIGDRQSYASNMRHPNYQLKGVNKILLPEGFNSIKVEFETYHHGIDAQVYVKGNLHATDKVKKYIDSSKHDDFVMDIVVANDSTFLAYDENGNLIGMDNPIDSKDGRDYQRTLELDKKNLGKEVYHSSSYARLIQKEKPKTTKQQSLTKSLTKKTSYNNHSFYNGNGPIVNDKLNKQFIIPCHILYAEKLDNLDKNGEEPTRQFHKQESGTFYDLLPLGVTGVQNLEVSGKPSGFISDFGGYYSAYYYTDKNTGDTRLNSEYKLIPNWKNSGRTMLIVSFKDAEISNMDTHGKKFGSDEYSERGATNSFVGLTYDMIYPWDSYKDYGSEIDRNLVAYESGFEKSPNDGLDDSLTNELECGYNDSNPGLRKEYSSSTEKYDKETKIFTDQEIEWMKDLNPNHDEKRFLYAQASTTVSGDTEANVGLTKHVSTDINPNFTLKSSTKEGGNYQYKIRLQAAHGTSVSNLVFFDSIENYDPLKADEDYGIKQWRGKLSSIDLNHPIMKGIAPKVYVSTKPKLDIEKHNDVSDSTIWKLYKEGDDLSNVQAVAIDLRKNKDGSDFKLEQDTAINVYLNMKAPWNLKEKQIDPKAKALNAIYASNTVTTSLDNKSTKLIYTAYTAVDLKPVTTETQIKATKKHLDKEGKDIALKGDDFKFELRDSNNKVLQIKTNDNKGNITFDPIKYNSWDVGEHTYKVVEVKGDSETTAYDSHEEIVKVKVEREGNSNLKATTTYDQDGAIFTNHEVDPITTSLEAKKVYIGKGGLEEKPTTGAFEFILKDSEGKEVAKVKNDAEGKVVFEGLEFKPNQIGEHKYTIEEVKGNNPAIEYDNTKKNVTVNVSLTKDFKLKADVVYDKGEIPTFTNTLKSASLQLVKLKEGSKTFALEEVKDANGFLTSYKVPEAQKDNVLDGAEYELYKIESDGTETLVDKLITKNGISQVVQDIMPGKYKLKETKAPKGYTLNDKDLIFDITDKDAGTIVAKFATDDSIIDMPSTGGQGTKALMIGGGILVAVMAGVLTVANKKKKEELNK